MSSFPDPPKNAHGGIWKDAEGNVDWDAYADEAEQAKWDMEDLGDNRSISRGYGGGCVTCDGGGCGDCR